MEDPAAGGYGLTVAPSPAGGTKRRRSGLRKPRRTAEELFPPGTTLGDLEQALREHGPCSIERLAGILGRVEAEVLEGARAHPMLFVDGAGDWSIVPRVPADFADTDIPAPDSRAKNAEPAVMPSPRRLDFGPAITLSRLPLPRDRFELYAGWWLKLLSDDEIVRLCTAIFDDGDVESVRAWRARLVK